MKNQTIHLAENLAWLRQNKHCTQEELAEKIGVSRQAVAKWEIGESVPDIIHCDALAELFEVSVDDLLHHNPAEKPLPIPPRGKHLFGAVKVGERGQIVLPKKARELFHIRPGDMLIVLGDEAPERAGIALVTSDTFIQAAEFFQRAAAMAEAGDEEEEP